MKTKLFLFAMLLWAAAGCSSLIKVYSEAEPGVNIYKYHTYSWRIDPAPGSSNIYLSEAAANDIRASIDQQMMEYGFKVCTEQPELLLHFHVVVENKVYYQHDWNCGDDGRPGFGYCHRVNPAYFREGTLMIDLVDAGNGNQVWRGVAVGLLENTTPAERGRLIDEAVRKIFEKFPGKKWPAIAGKGGK